jgi:hypothetical protein
MGLEPKDRAEILRLLPGLIAEKDLAQTSLKEVRAELEKRMGLQPSSLDPFKSDIKELTTAEIQLQAAKSQEAAPPAGADEMHQPADRGETSSPAAGDVPEPAEGLSPKPDAVGDSAAEDQGRKGSSKGTKGKKRAAESSKENGGAAKQIKLKNVQKEAMTRKAFMEAAKSYVLTVGDNKIKLEPKQFSTGSVGFFASQKIRLDVGDVEGLQLQAGINFTVVGSKEWKDR